MASPRREQKRANSQRARQIYNREYREMRGYGDNEAHARRWARRAASNDYDAIRRQDSRIGRQLRRIDTNQTRTAQYLRNRNSGMSHEASMNDVRRSEASGFNNPFPRRMVTPDGVSRVAATNGITTSNVNPSNQNVTQGQKTASGGGGGVKAGGGSGG